MDRTIEFTYPKRFAKEVARDYVRQQVWGTLFSATLMVCFIAAFIPRSPGWEVPALTLSIAVGLTAIILLSHYTSTVKRWNEFMERLLTPDARLRLTDEGITVASSNGSHEIPWRTIRIVVRSVKMTYFTISSYEAITLPACAIDDEAWDFIEARVKAHGGTCRSRRKRA